LIVERSRDRAPAVLVSRTPLSGWTHLAVVYREGKPALYLNGKLDREGRASGSVVHPGIDAPPAPGATVYYFDGDMTGPEVVAESLSAERIAGLAAKGLPDPEPPPPIELRRGVDGTVAAQVWQFGKYALDDGRSLSVPWVAGPIEVPGPWQLSLPEGAGTPAEVTMQNLVSLHKLADRDMRHLAGTVNYRNSFELSSNAISGGKRLWLDLGRVAVIAEVRLNGRDLGMLWKPPFRVDVTDAVRAGTNELEVRVTNLLVNRLIGDEELPPENEYDSRTRAILRLPDWFKEGKPKPPGGRTTFATWHYYAKGDPLVESGLIGPVRLLTSVPATFKP